MDGGGDQYVRHWERLSGLGELGEMNFYLVPTDHYIVDFILLHGFQLQLTRVLDYKSCSHLQTAFHSPLMSSEGQMKV